MIQPISGVSAVNALRVPCSLICDFRPSIRGILRKTICPPAHACCSRQPLRRGPRSLDRPIYESNTMNSFLRRFPTLAVAMALMAVAVSPQVAQCGMVFNNLMLSTDSSDLVRSDLWQAAGFKVENGDDWVLQSATIRMGNATTPSGGFSLRIYAENEFGFGPTNPVLATLVGSANPSTAGEYTYTVPGAGLSVQSGSTYWLVASVTSGDGIYLWNTVGNGYAVGVWSWPEFPKVWSLQDGIDGPWYSEVNYPFLLSLSASNGSSPVPEIDPAGMGSVVALVTGALGLLERRRLKAA